MPGRLFRIAAVAEACSWAGLLVGMVLDHILDVTHAGVAIFGPIHGGMFVFYVLSTVWLARSAGWSLARTAVGVLCSVPPFGTLLFERSVRRSAQVAQSSI